MLEQLIKALVRRNCPVIFSDPRRSIPVSRVFGMDRGTPIDRYYIERFLSKNAGLIRGRVLEIGDCCYSRRFGTSVERFEVLHATSENQAATIIGDLTDVSTLPSGSIDCFICTQTFNFIFDVEKAIVGACHLLKPGGVLLATVAGISQISRYDMDRWGDYWRFTTASVEKLIRPVFEGCVEIESFGNVLAATALLQGLAIEDLHLPESSLLDEQDPDYQVLITIKARKAA